MPTSGIYRTNLATPLRQPASTGGFTLLELMVVLAMVGIVAALALPNLSNMYDSINRSTERDYILDQLATLGQRAWTNETNLVVYGTADADTADIEVSDFYRPESLQPENAAARNDYRDYQEHSLDLPAGWVMRLKQPMRVRASGVCLGAELTLIHDSGVSYRANLEPPYCHASS